jgi:hypothetical protein
VRQLRYPAPNYVPLWLGGRAATVPIGTQARVLTLQPKFGMKRLRLTHLIIGESGQTDGEAQVICTIPGLSDLQSLNGKQPSGFTIPLFYTIDAQAGGTIDVINNEVSNYSFSIILSGFYDNEESDYQWEGTDWQKYLMPDKHSIPFIKRFDNPPVTFQAPFTGNRIRLYGAQGNLSGFGISGNGVSHLNSSNLNGAVFPDTRGYVPLLGHLIPGEQYTVTGDDLNLLGWAYK